MPVETIAKEQVSQLSFSREDVLLREEDRKARYHMLTKALMLGNNYHSKVRITFHTKEGPRLVITTVWQLSPHYVTLKSGVNIPIHSISEIGLE